MLYTIACYTSITAVMEYKKQAYKLCIFKTANNPTEILK